MSSTTLHTLDVKKLFSYFKTLPKLCRYDIKTSPHKLLAVMFNRSAERSNSQMFEF